MIPTEHTGQRERPNGLSKVRQDIAMNLDAPMISPPPTPSPHRGWNTQCWSKVAIHPQGS